MASLYHFLPIINSDCHDSYYLLIIQRMRLILNKLLRLCYTPSIVNSNYHELGARFVMAAAKAGWLGGVGGMGFEVDFGFGHGKISWVEMLRWFS